MRLRDGHSVQDEYRVVWPDGSVHWVRETASRRTGPENGKVMALDGIVSDVTDASKPRGGIGPGALLLNTLMDNLPDPIYFKDPKAVFCASITAMCRPASA